MDSIKRIERLERVLSAVIDKIKKLPEHEENVRQEKQYFRVLDGEKSCNTSSPEKFIYQKFPQKFPIAFQTLISFLECPRAFIDASAKIPNKFLLYGPPGCGKSYLGELIAREFGLQMIYLKASDFEDSYYGESTRKITQLFNTRSTNGRPLLIFIDEIDSIAAQRNEKISEARRSAVNALLVELQKISFDSSIIVLVATNDKESLDKALLSRFEGLCVEIKAMTSTERKLFLEDLVQNLPVIKKQETINILAKKIKGLSRRAVATAIESANAWSVSKYRHSMRVITADDILLFINQANRDTRISFGTALRGIIAEISPYLNFSHTLLGTIAIMIQLSKNMSH